MPMGERKGDMGSLWLPKRKGEKPLLNGWKKRDRVPWGELLNQVL